MGRQFTFLLALGLLAGAAASVSIAGWILFVRDRRSSAETAAGASPNTPPETTPDANATT
jgi:preprotein translocase subunit SecF